MLWKGVSSTPRLSSASCKAASRSPRKAARAFAAVARWRGAELHFAACAYACDAPGQGSCGDLGLQALGHARGGGEHARVGGLVHDFGEHGAHEAQREQARGQRRAYARMAGCGGGFGGLHARADFGAEAIRGARRAARYGFAEHEQVGF